MDLDNAIDVARAIYGNVGQGDCDEDQLAAWLSLSPKSSGFRVRLATARMFGVIESSASGALKVTALGRQIGDPNQVGRFPECAAVSRRVRKVQGRRTASGRSL